MTTQIASAPRFHIPRALAAVAVAVALGALTLVAVAGRSPEPAPHPDGALAAEDWHGNVRASHWQPLSGR